MRERLIPLVDRLNERGWIDRWGFLLFAFVGSMGILLAKGFGSNAVWVATGAAFFMLLYAVIVHQAGTGRIRSDQAGDNCYYLGLIFTLVSLAYAIFTFDPVDTATTIVQGFGIALSTTIAGLMLRVFFNQSRVDLVETEESTRLELAEAAGKLKAELSQIALHMHNFGDETVQRLTELRSAVAREMESARADLEVTSTAARETVELQAREAQSRMRRLATATEKVAADLESHGEGLRNASEANRAAMAGLASVAGATQTAITAINENVSRIGSIVDELGQAARRIDEELANRIADLKRAPVEGVAEASMTLTEASSRIRDELERVAQVTGEAARRLAADVETALASANRHNEGLDAALAASRGKVDQVHQALVDMTGDLVRQVAAEPAA